MRRLLLIVIVVLFNTVRQGVHIISNIDHESEDNAVQEWECEHSFSNYHEKCGDICTKWYSRCSCGIDNFNIFNDRKFCCVNGSDTQSEQCRKNGRNGICEQGTALSMHPAMAFAIMIIT